MKKYLLLASVAALAFTSCSDQSTEFVGDSAAQKAREIAFVPLAKPTTRTPVQGTTFPTGNSMQVKAYQSAPTAAAYFPQTTFSKGTSYWEGATKRYWPLSEATINFFAVSGASVAATDITIGDALATATVEFDATAANNTSNTAYSATTQDDIMYAFSRGYVTKSGNTLTFNNSAPVAMEFKHALALINFQIKAGDAASKAIKIYKIELDGARYTGDLTITNENAATVSGVWSAKVDWVPNAAVNDVQVPNIGNTTPVPLTEAFVPDNSNTEDPTKWASLMIIPKTQTTPTTDYGFTSFTIYYQLNDNDYEYTYAPTLSGTTPTTTVVEAGKKYTYQITMTLHEILINPTVDDWDNASGSPFSVGI